MSYSIPGDIRTKIQSSTSIGGIDSPFTKTRAVLDMMKGWEIMKAVTEGTEYLRENSEAFLPLEPREDFTAYMARVNRAVFSPFTQRLIRAATGSNLKAPVTKKSGLTESEKRRRKSFCSRMEGMKRKMTNIKKKNDPDSRINKALKRWRC